MVEVMSASSIRHSHIPKVQNLSKKGFLIWILEVWSLAEGPFFPLDLDLIQPDFIGVHGPLSPGVGFLERLPDRGLILALGLLQDLVDEWSAYFAP